MAWGQPVGGERRESMWNAEILKEQLNRGQFFLLYKPHYDVNQFGLVVAVEATVRYRNNDNEVLRPKSFLPELEKQDLIGLLDVWVLNKACQMQEKLYQTQETVIPIIINLSAWTVCNPYHVYDLILNLHGYALPGNSIQMALTSTTPFLSTYGLNKGVSFLQQKGLRVMLNRFGSEFTTLSLFSDLAFDKLQVDRQFFKAALKSGRIKILLNHVILLSKSLHMDLICDGVDSLAELQFAKSLGVRYVHGDFLCDHWSEEQLMKNGYPMQGNGMR